MIEAKSLVMNYGSTRALDGVSFRVGEGEIVGLLGPNGAGKTTLMRILTTFIYPAQGTALVGGHDVTRRPLEARKILGYLPETPPLYADMRVDEFIDFVGRARGLSGALLKKRKDWAAQACGISPVWKHGVHELSLGYRQRVGLAQALIHDPRVVILDEPTSGLDPLQIVGIRGLIRELAKTKTILFSTHVLQEASAISQRLFIINRGKLVAQGTPEELRAAGDRREELLHVTLDVPRQEAEAALAGLKSVKRAVYVGEAFGGQRFQLAAPSYGEAVKALNELARAKNWPLKELSPELPSLENVFLGFFSGSDGRKDGA
ncbi:MAG TPA: ATP-binding cassette domain-containing protein [Candidatus Eisenbacteria bacterium]|nr:ATP-binding cassette domain-containing protein [Candidatus Eisenbacteria bacterium]